MKYYRVRGEKDITDSNMERMVSVYPYLAQALDSVHRLIGQEGYRMASIEAFEENETFEAKAVIDE